MRRDPFFLNRPVSALAFKIGPEKQVRDVAISKENRCVFVQPLAILNAIVSVIEDRFVGIDESVRFDRQLIAAHADGARTDDFE